MQSNLTVVLGFLIVGGVILYIYASPSSQLGLVHKPSSLPNTTEASQVISGYMHPVNITMIRTPLSPHNVQPLVQSSNQKMNIGIVKNTFTAAAYNNAFYTFYLKHANEAKLWANPANPGCCIKTDLNLLTGKIPSDSGEYVIGNTTYYRYDAYEVLPIVDHIKQLLPQANIKILTDGDIHEGIGNSCCDILILGHQEYVTQQEYSNLKKFVENGGMLVLLDGNVFYAEVTYNKTAQTVTLVNGHNWAFDLKTVSRGTNERWAKETSQWIGSNYYYWRDTKEPTHPALIFTCPCAFRYQTNEEQYITNPNVKILRNYDAKTTIADIPTPIIATYEKYYGKGKIIVFGIYSDEIIYRPDFADTAGFLNFFDKVFKSAIYNKEL